MNGFCEVLATQTSLLEFEVVEMQLATTVWFSPDYFPVRWMMPVALVTVRRLIQL